MKLSSLSLFTVFSLICSNALSQLPDQLMLDFDQPSDYVPADWLFVAPTPLGVTRADPDTTVSVSSEGDWTWSIQSPNEVLVAVNPSFDLTDSQVETTFDFVGSGGISIGFLNRFGAVGGLAHGYCTLVSPETITLIDFDFAREQADYIRALAQVPTPDGLFTGAETTVVFQTHDQPSTADPNVVVPTFDFWLGGTQVFAGVEDPNASWSSGFAGVDVWTVDPFAQMTTDAFNVNFDNFAIRGEPVPEPSGLVLCGFAALGMLRFRCRRRD